ncbi:conserved oligomeric Golgi complex subunit 4 [Drosophila guanche]|uniref:Conserved oligomeric Golgi complex subunit 4 n=1 Tax=Drosophila guanche TaxID=7266 RepID=A0A3B0JHN3_DROGU|nr:conserved oligomeric Golgi complex subunit 4 [Drosophila guanche]SPP81705.1 blast:Conserved oligomeric Golgi complex subunit 4 [Drosophila guanche]
MLFDTSSSEISDQGLLRIAEEEEKVNNKLEQLLVKQCQIEAKMSGIGRAMVLLHTVDSDSTKLNMQIVNTAQLAESVSAKVRRLDLARCRASECQQRVHDLIDLQLCSQGVVKAVIEEDFEKGAAHVARFLAMDQQLLHRTADDVSITSVSDAVQTLEDATEKIRELISRRFDEAVKSNDLASVERFFKIFPLVGYHRIGIDKFSKYICLKLSDKAQKELRNVQDIAKAECRLQLAYADRLTSILENFARVVEVNQPIVEAYYGQESASLIDMIAILQEECDAEAKNLLLEFNKNRQIVYRSKQVYECTQRSSNGTTSSNSIPSLGHYRKPSGGSIDKLNPKEIDAIIAEITVMHSRVELYFRFMRRRMQIHVDTCVPEKEDQIIIMNRYERIVKNADLRRQMQEILSTYLLFERYFMEESVLKAIGLDKYEAGQQCSSIVDDVFFILRKSIRRALTTQSINGTCAVINNVAACLDGDFIAALKTPLKSGYTSGYIDLAQAYNAIQTTLQQGKLHSTDADRSRTNFLVQLNNADMSTEYIETLCQTMELEIAGTFPCTTPVERQLLDSCLTELKAVRDALKATVDFGMQQLRSSAIKPRINPWINKFLSYSHNLTEEELAIYEAEETFVQFFIVHLDGLLNSFKTALSPRNYDALVSILATEVTIQLERAIKKCSFNRLGGLILDQEVRALGTYLTGATSWSVRDKMTRISQIATVLNLDKVSELSEFWSPDSNKEMPSWHLTLNEVRAILALRIDFRIEDIKRLQL